MSNSNNKTGYDLEERYFHESEIEKISSIREQRTAMKKKLEKEMHWMRCPKCGGQMNEVELEGILIEKCEDCSGIYFDQGELEALMNHRESDGFFNKVCSLFK